MIIITDTIEYTEKVLAQKFNWQKQINPKLPSIIEQLSSKLFHEKVYCIDTELSAFCKYVFIVKYAPQSQFMVLMDVLKDNTFHEGILCIAESGDNFKGYRKRKWESIKGNLHISLFLNPNQNVKKFSVGFTILSTISVIQALNKIPELKGKPTIKWVNDIFIEGCKISGVLTQTQTTGNNITGVFLGIGVNVESSPQIIGDLIVPKAASLWNFIEQRDSCTQSIVMKNLIERIEINYTKLLKDQYDELLDIYRDNSIIIGKHVKIYSDPLDGKPQFETKGKVVSIGETLEIFLENEGSPITKGRVIME